MQEQTLKSLPPQTDFETKAVLKQLAKAHRALTELKVFAETMTILINATVLNEAKDSSAIENIITTHDELFRAMSHTEYSSSAAAKEVVDYRSALWLGYSLVRERHLLTTNMMIEIQEQIEKNRGGIRKLHGTVLRNERTGEVGFTPPSGDRIFCRFLLILKTTFTTRMTA